MGFNEFSSFSIKKYLAIPYSCGGRPLAAILLPVVKFDPDNGAELHFFFDTIMLQFEISLG